MASITFTFSPNKKVIKSKTSTISKPTTVNSSPLEKYTVVARDLNGVIWITIDGFYKVVIGDDVYDILERNYRCAKKKSLYYEQLVENKLVQYIRHMPAGTDKVSGYLPFGVGCSVTGMLVKRKRDERTFFNIKKVFVDKTNPDAIKAINFYRQNLNIINQNREKANDKV